MVRMLVRDDQAGEITNRLSPRLQRGLDLPDADAAIDKEQVVPGLEKVGVAGAAAGEAADADRGGRVEWSGRSSSSSE